TRPSDPTKQNSSSGSQAGHGLYRNFNSGARALGASEDPLDREIAERLSLAAPNQNYHDSKLKLSIDPRSAGALLAKLAQSGRLYFNLEYSLHDQLTPLGWLSDDPFDLKFEIAPTSDGESLELGLAAV